MDQEPVQEEVQECILCLEKTNLKSLKCCKQKACMDCLNKHIQEADLRDPGTAACPFCREKPQKMVEEKELEFCLHHCHAKLSQMSCVPTTQKRALVGIKPCEEANKTSYDLVYTEFIRVLPDGRRQYFLPKPAMKTVITSKASYHHYLHVFGNPSGMTVYSSNGFVVRMAELQMVNGC